MSLVFEASSHDKARVLEMSARFFAESQYGALYPPAPGRLEALFDLALEQGVILLGQVDGDIVGMLAIVAVEHPFSGVRFGDELAWWVDPEHRHGRLGPKMLCAAEAWAHTKGVSVLKLASPAGSSVGMFLERRGYTAIETAYQKRIT